MALLRPDGEPIINPSKSVVTTELPFQAVTQNVLEDRCISIKKELDFKWDIESCKKKYHFVCETTE